MRAIWVHWKGNFILCGRIYFKSKCSNWLPTGFWFSDLPPAPDTVLDKLFLCCFSSCCPRIITWLQSQSSMKTLVKGNRLETWLWIWEKLKKFGSTFTISSFANFRINSTLLTALGLLVSNFRYFNLFHFV